MDTEALFSKNAMKAVAQTLSELVFKDIKVCYDLATALKSSQQDDIKFVFDTDIEATNILEVTSWEVLNVQKTTASLPVLQDYAAYLMSQSFLDASSVDSDEYYQKDMVMKQMGMSSLANYETSKLYAGEDTKWGVVKDIIGIDNADVRSIQLTMFTISDFLQKMDKDSVFPEEIRQLMNFENGFVMDKMIYPALASFVHLRQGFDKFMKMSRSFEAITAKFKDQLVDKLEYIELMNLMTKQIKNQQIITNQKFKLLKYEMFQDLMQIVVEVRNYAIMYQNVVLTV